MILTQPGFVAQLKGKLTIQCYKAATVFVDHFSSLRYIHTMTSMPSNDTIKAKQAFEQFATNHFVIIKHCHANNDHFTNNAFINHCSQLQQQLTNCRVNAHFQNGLAERAIRDITKGGRKQLLYAMARWPQVVDLALWPYTLCYATFACPVFALQNSLAAGNTMPHWSPRACLGLNLGPSPFHACNVYLVLNLMTGLVSLQYHCRFDDFFETVKLNGSDINTSANWKQLAGFCRTDGTPTAPNPQGIIGNVSSLSAEPPEPAQSNPIEFVQEFELNDDVNIPHDMSTNPVQDSEGANPTAPTLLNAGTSSHGRQHKITRQWPNPCHNRILWQ
ncbi:hypothetical protein ACHAW6_003275 [Cyclotella cf. meneghiniana]